MERRSTLLRVGWIGLGIMGRPMAENVLRAGFRVVAYNRSAARREAFVATGGRTVASPRDVAVLSDVVVTMVSDTPDVEEVVFGANGAAEGMQPGSVLVDMSTISPKPRGNSRAVSANGAWTISMRRSREGSPVRSPPRSRSWSAARRPRSSGAGRSSTRSESA